MNKHNSVVVFVATLLLLPAIALAHTFQTDLMIDADRGGVNDVSVGPDNISLAFDSLGNEGMCYFDSTHGDLKFAFNDGNGWSFETAHADPAGDVVGAYCAIVFDDDDNPNIVYFNTTDRAILHAVKRGGLWTIGTVDMPVGVDMFGLNRLSLAKNGVGELGVAYYDAIGRDLKYAKFSNARWVVSVVRNVGDVGRYASLDFDSHNHPAIAYQDYTDMGTASLKLIAHNGNAWGAPETVDGTNNAGSYLSFKFDANDKPHIAYRHYDQPQQFYSAYYINKVGNAWSERLPLAQEMGPATGFYCQLVVDAFGNVHIVYMDQFVSALFPDANYLRMTTIYFASRGSSMMSSLTDRLAVSVLPMVDYVGLAIAVDDTHNLGVAWAQESGQNYDLVTAKLTNWTPTMVITSPNANTHSGRDTFTVEWEDQDPDSNATITFERLDANWVSVPFREVARENDANTLSLDLSQVPHGDYRIVSKIYDVDPNFYNTGWSPALLTVENHVPSAPNLAGPADRAVVDTATPTLQWEASSDVDNDVITYQAQVATDDAFANIVASGNGANAQWAPANALNNNTIYHWRVRAVDAAGGNSVWTAARQFSTNIPVAQAPAAGAAAGGGNAPAAGGGNNAGNNNAGNNAGQVPAGAADPGVGGGNAPVVPVVGGGAGQGVGVVAGAAGAAAGGSGSSSANNGSGAVAAAAPAAGESKGGCSLIRH